MDKTKTLTVFKSQLLDFLDDVINIAPHEPNIKLLKIFVKDTVPIEFIMSFFVEYSCPEYLQRAQNRDDEFFLRDNPFELNLDNSTKVKEIEKLWRSDYLSDEEKETIWDWVDVIIKIVEHYKKNFV